VTHDLFGRMKFKERDESWAAIARLPRFAARGARPDAAPQTEEEAARAAAELNTAMEQMRAVMRERFGERAAAAFDAADAAADAAEQNPEPPDPRDEERERRRAEKRAKRAAALAKGQFPVRVAGPNQAAPTAAQEAAFRHLRDHEAAVLDAVLGAVWTSYQERAWPHVFGMPTAETPDRLHGHFAIARLDIAREARGGFAYLLFLIDADWGDDNGPVIAYAPDTGEATWTTWEGLYELLESDAPADADADAEFVPTPHDHLLEAVLTGDDAKARELIAAGADLNALHPHEYPPLWVAVDHMEPDEVRRLLEYGADPALANPDERSTPLKHARKLYHDLGFGPAARRPAPLDGVLSMVREAAGPQLDDMRARLEAIIAALETAKKA
jgi:hypothetical protein